MHRTLLCLVLVSSLAARTTAQVAYVKDNRVYVLTCDRSGLPPKESKPVKVCDLWPDQGRHVFQSIGWVAPGKIWLIRSVEREGLAPKQSIYMVDAREHAKPVKLADGVDPAFSPNGSTMAYTSSDNDGDIWLLDLGTKRRTLKVNHAEQPAWSGDGKSFVYVTRDKDFSGIVTIRSYPGWKLIRTLRPQVSPVLIFLSHDASKAAVEFSLSRPKMGHTVFDFKTGSEVALDGPGRFAPPEIDDWSPDESHFLSSYRTIDPDNDGVWIKNQLGISNVKGTQLTLLSIGYQGRFAVDGHHVLTITDHKTGLFNRHGDLVWQSLQDGSKQILARNVTDYAVFRPR